jgi:hypothetical protein
MTLYLDAMFSLPLAVIPIENWQEKRNRFLEILRSKNVEKREGENIRTNYSGENFSDIMNVQEILKDEILQIEQESNVGSMYVGGSWVEIAEQGMHHVVHNHGAVGLSAVCYLKYNPECHTPVTFISPFNNFFTGDLIHCVPENIKEGILLIFPSYIQHFTLPNESRESRVALSFNLRLKS